MSKNICLIVFFCLGSLFHQVFAQEQKNCYPDGLHLGIISTGNLSQRASVFPCEGNMPMPQYNGGVGWKTGVELSYNFCRYFGISIGVDYGSVVQVRRKIFIPYRQYFPEIEDKMEKCRSIRKNGIQIPLRMEFHYPFRNTSLALCFSLGANLLNVMESIDYSIYHKDLYSRMFKYSCDVLTEEGLECVYDDELLRSEKNAYMISADLLLGIGVCYKLPYSDLIRAKLTMNYSFKDCLMGFYSYPQANSWGTITYRNNCVGIEIAYIHCFGKKEKRLSHLRD